MNPRTVEYLIYEVEESGNHRVNTEDTVCLYWRQKEVFIITLHTFSNLSGIIVSSTFSTA